MGLFRNSCPQNGNLLHATGWHSTPCEQEVNGSGAGGIRMSIYAAYGQFSVAENDTRKLPHREPVADFVAQSVSALLPWLSSTEFAGIFRGKTGKNEQGRLGRNRVSL